MSIGNKLIKENYPEFEEEEYKLAFLNLFKTTNSSEEDKTNTKIWWIINNEQRDDIADSFSWKVKHTKQKTKKDILTILKLRDSLNWKKNLYFDHIEGLIKRQSQDLWLWLEFFLWDAIERNNKNPNLSFEKPWQHLDQLYCSDLILTYLSENWGKTNIWIDFTTTTDKIVRWKKLWKMKKVNKELKKNWIKDYSVKRTPQSTWIIFIDRKQLLIKSNELSKALNLFYDAKNLSGWPLIYLKSWKKDSINNLAKIIISVFEKISKNDFSNYKVKNNNAWEYHISFQRNLNRLVVRAWIERNLLFEFIVDLPEVDEED